jgi:hypothetical protein
MHCFVHCRFLQLSAAQSCAAWAWWSRRSLFQHARPQSTHMHCFVLQIHCSSVQHWGCCGLERGGYDARCFSMHALNPGTCCCFVHCRFTAAQCSSLGAAWSVSGRDAHCSSMHTPQSTHMHCFVHCRFTAAQLQHSLGCSLEREWYDARCSACTRLESTHMHCFVHCRFTCAQCSTSLGCSLEREWLRRSLFNTRPRIVSPAVHCSAVQQVAVLAGALRWLLVVSACTASNPRTCIAQSTADSLQLSPAQSWVQPGA